MNQRARRRDYLGSTGRTAQQANPRKDEVMSKFKKIAAGTLAALAITVGTLATSSTEAHAWGKKGWFGKHVGFGIAAGVIGAAAFAAHASHYHGYGPVSCRYVERYDVFGRYLGTFKRCRYL
jgi:hypothetical protein